MKTKKASGPEASIEQARDRLHSQEGIDHEQAITDLEQSVGDRDQAVGDIEQRRIDRAQADRETDCKAADPADVDDAIRFEHRRLDLDRAQARRHAHQEQLDRAQIGRDSRQDVLGSQQAMIDDPGAAESLPSEAELALEAERRSEAAIQRAEAASRRAHEAIERAEEVRQRLTAFRERREQQ